MTQFDEALGLFGDLSIETVAGLSSMIALVEEGIAPTAKRSEELANLLGNLRESYEKVKTLAYEELGNELDASEDLPAIRYKEQIEELRTKIFKRQVERARDLLKDFIRVDARDEFCKEALRPAQEEARETFEMLSGNPSEITIDEGSLAVSVDNPRDFMNALQIDDYGSGEGAALLNRIQENMSMGVVIGLTTKKYYLPDVSKRSEPLPEGLEEDPAARRDEPTPCETGSQVNLDSVRPNGNGYPDSGLSAVKTVDEPPSVQDSDESIEPIRPVRATARLGVKSVENKFLKKMPDGSLQVISILMRFGACTTEQVVAFSKYLAGERCAVSTKEVEACISSMERFDLACTYSLDDKPVHCMTQAGQQVLMKETIRNHKTVYGSDPFWPIPFEEHDCKAGSTMSANALRRVVMENDGLLDRYGIIKESKGYRAASAALKSTRRVDGKYVMAPSDEQGADGCDATLTKNDEGVEYASPSTMDGEVEVSAQEVVRNEALSNQTVALTKCGIPDVGAGGVDNPEAEGGSFNPGDAELIEHGQSGHPDKGSGFIEDAQRELLPHDSGDESVLEADSSRIDGGAILGGGVPQPAGEGAGVSTSELQADEGWPRSIIDAEVGFDDTEEKTWEEDGHAPTQGVRDRALSYVSQPACQPDSVMRKLAIDMVNENVAAETNEVDMSSLLTAASLMRSLSDVDGYEGCSLLHRQLRLAVEPFAEDVAYTSSSLAEAFPESLQNEEALVLSSYLNAMIFPRWGRQDHDLWSQCERHLVDFETAFPSYGSAKTLYRTLFALHEVSNEGFSRKVMKQIEEGSSYEKQLSDLQARAGDIGRRTFNFSHPYAAKFSQKCIGAESEIGRSTRMLSGEEDPDRDFLVRLCRRFSEPGDGDYVISSEKIIEFLEGTWHDLLAELDGGKKNGRIEKLKPYQRDPSLSACKERINLVIEWLIMNDGDIDPSEVSKLRAIRSKALVEISKLLNSGDFAGVAGSGVVTCALRNIERYLRGGDNAKIDYRCFLTSGFVTLDDDLIPVINSKLNSVVYAEPWRNVLRHYLAEPLSLEDAERCISDPESSMCDNLTQLAHIQALLGKTEKQKTTEKRVAQAIREADARLEKFQDELEMDVLYDRIDDDQKETIDSCWRAYKDYFYEQRDFGLWSQFLDALRRQVEDLSDDHFEVLSRRLDDRCQGLVMDEDSPMLDTARKLLVEERNFATVEEYINLYDEGETSFLEAAEKPRSPETLSRFLDDKTHGELYTKCVQQMKLCESFSTAAKSILKETTPEDWDSEQKARSRNSISHWPDSGIMGYEAKSVGNLLRAFGFDVIAPKETKVGTKSTQYEVKLKKVERGRTDYPHPISMFGTRAESILQVLVFPERADISTLFDEVEKLSNTGMTVVIVDKALRLDDRRRMAEMSHTEKSGLSPFICIDRVLAVHLLSFEPGERMAELLRCTLPFTRCQPFTNGSSSIPDEMFFGRRSELRKIMDPDGPTLVYGGRQLGKSALLERAEYLFTNGKDRHVSALCKIENVTTDEELVDRLVEALHAKGLKLGQKIDSLEGLCARLERAILVEKRADRILLLIDEADNYLKAIRENSYSNLNPMINLKRKTQGQFKFVLAGLHNVIRARKAFENNGALGQLGEPLCIRPLARQDALQLVVRPLSFLGYHVDEYPHLMTILTKTNYYPGVLQFFGYTLVESISDHYHVYYRASDGNPPYALEPKQLGAILNKKVLRENIESRFRMSLDQASRRYKAIARVFALLYRECEEHDENIRERDGFEASEVWNWIEVFKFPQFVNDDKESFIGLLDEMCDMNILFKNDGEKPLYRLRHYDFLRIIGGSTVDEILEELGGTA